MKVSIITAVYNRAGTIGMAVESLQAQTRAEFEHVVMDGGSTDSTIAILEGLADHRTVITSEPDKGIYDALNKGLSRASGDIIGLLPPDDVLARNDVLARVAQAFASEPVDSVYGDLDYVRRDDPARIVRRWRAGEFTRERLRYGWMPPHPASTRPRPRSSTALSGRRPSARPRPSTPGLLTRSPSSMPTGSL